MRDLVIDDRVLQRRRRPELEPERPVAVLHPLGLDMEPALVQRGPRSDRRSACRPRPGRPSPSRRVASRRCPGRRAGRPARRAGRRGRLSPSQSRSVPAALQARDRPAIRAFGSTSRTSIDWTRDQSGSSDPFISSWGVAFELVDGARAAEPAVGRRHGETADREPVRRRRVARVHDQAEVPIEPLGLGTRRAWFAAIDLSGADSSSRRAVQRSLPPSTSQASRTVSTGRGEGGRARSAAWRPGPGSSRRRSRPIAPHAVRRRWSASSSPLAWTPATARVQFHCRRLHGERHLALSAAPRRPAG